MDDALQNFEGRRRLLPTHVAHELPFAALLPHLLGRRRLLRGDRGVCAVNLGRLDAVEVPLVLLSAPLHASAHAGELLVAGLRSHGPLDRAVPRQRRGSRPGSARTAGHSPEASHVSQRASAAIGARVA